MTSTILRSRITWVALLLTAASSLMNGAEMKTEDVIARHLSSIGIAEARSAVKSRIVQGTSRFKAVVSGGGELQGTGALVSEGRKAVVMVKLASGDYRTTEVFEWDIAADELSNNAGLDPRNFQVR